MKVDELLRLYDREYAERYNELFLLSKQFKACTEYETQLLSRLLVPGVRWLDVACGTGYFLSRFPNLKRAGLDISPYMLEVARRENPAVSFHHADFRSPAPELEQRWSLVTCMWYAYCYVDSVQEVEVLVKNLCNWTSAGGTCFMPICDPEWLCESRLPYRVSPEKTAGGHLRIDAVVWNWIDDGLGKEHTGLIAPHVRLIIEMFRPDFEEIEIVKYPVFEDDWINCRLAILAHRKLPTRKSFACK